MGIQQPPERNDYATTKRKAAAYIEEQIFNRESVKLAYLYLQITRLYGLGKKTVDNHIENLQACGMVEIDRTLDEVRRK